MRGNAVGLDARHEQFGGIDWRGFLRALPAPASTIAARHTVGLVDAITDTDIQQPVNDGLPESLQQVIARYGHRHFKLKVGGKVGDDIARLTHIASVLDGIDSEILVSLDGNEQYDSAEGVAELLARMREEPALQRLWRAIAFIEQPIHRKSALGVDVRAIAADSVGGDVGHGRPEEPVQAGAVPIDREERLAHAPRGRIDLGVTGEDDPPAIRRDIQARTAAKEGGLVQWDAEEGD